MTRHHLRLPLVGLFSFLAASYWSYPNTVEAAAVYHFDTDTNGSDTRVLSGNTATFTTGTLTADGVDFVAQLTVTGNNVIGLSSSQLGVSNSVFNPTEAADFTVSVLTQSGGTVSFNGFTEIDFNSFTATGGDVASLNGQTLDANSTGTLDDFSLTVAPYSTPATINLVGIQPASGDTTSFGIAGVGAQFTGTLATAVPEPSSLAIFGAIGLGAFYRRRRKQSK